MRKKRGEATLARPYLAAYKGKIPVESNNHIILSVLRLQTKTLTDWLRLQTRRLYQCRGAEFELKHMNTVRIAFAGNLHRDTSGQWEGRRSTTVSYQYQRCNCGPRTEGSLTFKYLGMLFFTSLFNRRDSHLIFSGEINVFSGEKVLV